MKFVIFYVILVIPLKKFSDTQVILCEICDKIFRFFSWTLYMPEERRLCIGWDATISVPDFVATKDDEREMALTIAKGLYNICSCFVFQGEYGDIEHKRHWQCRFLLKKRNGRHPLLKLMSSELNLDKYNGAILRISQTSGDVHRKKDFSYVMKVTELFHQPVSDKSYEANKVTDMYDIENDENIFHYVKTCHKTLFPWQSQIIDMIKKHIDYLKDYRLKIFDKEDYFYEMRRQVIFIIDFSGCNGKSILGQILEQIYKCYEIPLCNDHADLIKYTCSLLHSEDTPNRFPNGFFSDFPRAMEKRKLNGYFTTIEKIKDGSVYDGRYKANSFKFLSCPFIIFSNDIPDVSCLTRNRWKFYILNDAKELIHYTNPVDMYVEYKKYMMSHKEESLMDSYFKMSSNELMELAEKKLHGFCDDNITKHKYDIDDDNNSIYSTDAGKSSNDC